MDTYVMSKELFISLIHKAKEISSLYYLADVINAGCRDGELDVRGISHRGYLHRSLISRAITMQIWI